MNYKIKRKSWRRLVASLLAGLCLLTGSGAALAAQAAGAAVTQAASGDATTATPETAQAAADSEAVANEAATASRMGVTGVPCFLFEGKYAVMGAQDVSTLTDAIRQIAAAKARGELDA